MGSLSVALRATVRWRTSHPGTVSVPEEDSIEVQGRGAASGRLLEADHRRGAADAPLPRPRSAGGAMEAEVSLSAVAVVPDVQRGAPGEAADRAVRLVVVADADPQRCSAVACVPVVEVQGLRVVGEGRDDPAG